jgi:DNA-binding NarL/FixJ family response regulator
MVLDVLGPDGVDPLAQPHRPSVAVGIEHRGRNPIVPCRSSVKVTQNEGEAVREIAELLDKYDEVLAIVPERQITPFQIQIFEHLYEPALLRGVRMRSMYEDAIQMDAASSAFVHQTVRCGAHARSVKQIPLGTTIIGRSVAVLTQLSPGGSSEWWFVDIQRHVDASVKLFGQLWTGASVIHTSDSAHRVSSIERKILLLLVRGVKDDCAARLLNVSARTYRRHVTALCEQLGAPSRFAAGAKAAAAGLI